MVIRLTSKPARITRKQANSITKFLTKYYKTYTDDVMDLSLFVEEDYHKGGYRFIPRATIGTPLTEQDKVNGSRDRILNLQSAYDYNNLAKKPTQKELEDYIYYEGNKRLTVKNKDLLEDELLNRYLIPWAQGGIQQRDVPVQLVYIKEGTLDYGEDDEVFYSSGLTDEIFTCLKDWMTKMVDDPKYKDIQFNYIGNRQVRRKVADGHLEFKIVDTNIGYVVMVRIGVDKYGQRINLENYRV